MSEAELVKLERDVIQARARFAGDLAVLRSPDTLADFKDDVKSKALGIRDDLVEQARTSVTDTTDGFIADLKGRANANPGAVLAIGAGLAWYLLRKPPITSALVGFGLWSLWRTTPAPEGEGFGPRTVELAHAARDKVEDLRAQASEAVSHLADQAAAKADQVSSSVRRTVHDMQDAAVAAAGSVRETVHGVQDAAIAPPAALPVRRGIRRRSFGANRQLSATRLRRLPARPANGLRHLLTRPAKRPPLLRAPPVSLPAPPVKGLPLLPARQASRPLRFGDGTRTTWRAGTVCCWVRRRSPSRPQSGSLTNVAISRSVVVPAQAGTPTP